MCSDSPASPGLTTGHDGSTASSYHSDSVLAACSPLPRVLRSQGSGGGQETGTWGPAPASTPQNPASRVDSCCHANYSSVTLMSALQPAGPGGCRPDLLSCAPFWGKRQLDARALLDSWSPPPLLRLGGGLRVAYDPVPWGLPRRSEQRFPSQHSSPAWRHSDTQNLTVGLGSPRIPLQRLQGRRIQVPSQPWSAEDSRGVLG